MGCFSRCFGRCSNGYKKIGSHDYHEQLHVPDQKIESASEAQITENLKIVAEKVDNNEDQLNSHGELSFRTQIEECGNQAAAGEEEEEEEGSVTELQEVLYSEEEAEGKKQAEEISDSSEKEEMTGGGRTQEDSEDEILSDSSDSSLFTYPTSNKYKNYSERNAESDRRSTMIQEEESSESLFSLSIDSRRQSFTPGIEIEGDREVSSSSTVRRKVAPTMNNQEQENVIITDSGELTVGLCGRRKSSNSCRNGVDDTSFSSWLVESENEPDQEKNSSSSSSPSGSVGTSSLKENRPILRELTMDELNHISRHSSSSSPKRRSSSPRFFNPNETPILGTVGSYWKHTGGGNQLPMDAAVSGSTMSENCRMNNQTNNTLQTDQVRRSS